MRQNATQTPQSAPQPPAPQSVLEQATLTVLAGILACWLEVRRPFRVARLGLRIALGMWKEKHA